MFSRIIKEIINFANENEITDYPYYLKITRFDFIDFNKVYDSELLSVLGRVINEY